MIADQVRTFLNEAPFKPFTLHLASGKEIVVQHPDFAAFSTNYQMLIVGMEDGACRAVNLANITHLEGVLAEPS